jgi:hypothetical protein
MQLNANELAQISALTVSLSGLRRRFRAGTRDHDVEARISPPLSPYPGDCALPDHRFRLWAGRDLRTSAMNFSAVGLDG